jgi:non-heme chloroperoxidase
MNRSNPPRDAFFEADGARLHYLDWGGEGPAVVFLAGFGNTPHFFDGLAGKLADRFRVVGLTRRAHGASSAPESGYDVPTLAGDVVRFLDQLGIERASLAGHSFAGIELIQLALAHATRVQKLVFLDALYELQESDLELFGANPQLANSPPPDAFDSVEAYSEDFVARYPAYRRLRSPRWDALMAHALVTTEDGRFRERLRPAVAQQLGEAHFEFRTDWRRIRSPVLAFYAFHDESWLLPEDASPELSRTVRAFTERVDREYRRRCVDRARREIPGIEIVELTDTSHYCFLDREDEVVDAMREFLLKEAT